MAAREPGSRLLAYLDSDREFWSEGQVNAFRKACELAGVEPGRHEAERWRFQRGAAFTAWKATSRSRRKALTADGAAVGA